MSWPGAMNCESPADTSLPSVSTSSRSFVSATPSSTIRTPGGPSSSGAWCAAMSGPAAANSKPVGRNFFSTKEIVCGSSLVLLTTFTVAPDLTVTASGLKRWSILRYLPALNWNPPTMRIVFLSAAAAGAAATPNAAAAASAAAVMLRVNGDSLLQLRGTAPASCTRFEVNLAGIRPFAILLLEDLTSTLRMGSARRRGRLTRPPGGEPRGMPETAASPTDLPKDSWGATFKRTLTEFKEDKLNHWAAALTYYAVLSLFPALIVLVSLAGLVASPATVTKFLTDVISSVGPDSAVDTFKGPIESVTSSSGTAGIMAIVGVASALWSASGYVGAFTEASNSIYEVEEGRPVWKKKPLQLLITLVCIMLVAITALSLVLTGPLAKAVGDAVGLGDTAVTVWQYAKWPVLLGLVLVILHVLYFASPNAKVGVKWVSAGALITLVVWLIASALFALYVSMFGSYNKTYGSLAGVVVFLLWLWITNMAVLFGVEFNAETERTRELHEGVPGADEELKLPERDERKAKKQEAQTA